jgi:hypothetical protein
MHTGHPRKKKREEYVAEIFQSFSVPYVREFTISFVKCPRKYARLDFLLRKSWGWIAFEVDEHMHSGYGIAYECERMALIFKEFAKCNQGSLHIVRFNPDPYKEKNGILVKPSETERVETIRCAIEHVPEARLEITYLYYRMLNGMPEVAYQPDYTLRDHIRRIGP